MEIYRVLESMKWKTTCNVFRILLNIFSVLSQPFCSNVAAVIFFIIRALLISPDLGQVTLPLCIPISQPVRWESNYSHLTTHHLLRLLNKSVDTTWRSNLKVKRLHYKSISKRHFGLDNCICIVIISLSNWELCIHLLCFLLFFNEKLKGLKYTLRKKNLHT